MKKLASALILAAGLLAYPYIGQAAKVVIDPGHGGSDPGAVGINGLYEKHVNNEVSYRLKDILKEHGYEVVLTRDTDKGMSLQDRVEFARAADADLFVSVHANAHPSKTARGTMVLYHDAANPNPSYPASEEMKALSPHSKLLAQLILSSVLEQVPNTNLGLLQSSAYVVRMGNVPSVLVETAFLSNAQDAKMLASSAVREKYAVGIANGILKYLPPVFRDIGTHWAKDSILRLNEQGIANGDDGKFFPDRALTRAELMAFAARAFGFGGTKSDVSLAESASDAQSVTKDVYEAGTDDIPVIAEPAEEPAAAFKDLPQAHWSYEVMRDAVKSGVLRGYPDGTVRPDAPVTRAEVAVVLDRLIGTTLTAGSPDGAFADVDRDGWAWAYVSIMRLNGSGIVRGVAEGKYGPDRNVTRAEIATMVDRQLTRSFP